MTVTIVIHSKEETAIADALKKRLAEHRVDADTEICTVDTPSVEALAKKDTEVFIVGSGIGAKLAHLIAQKTNKPVIALPLKSDYEGFDALIASMQDELPLLVVGEENVFGAADYAAEMVDETDSIAIIGDVEHAQVKKAIKVIKSFEAPMEINPEDTEGMVVLRFLGVEQEVPPGCAINIPLIEKNDDEALAMLNLLKKTDEGLWVGMNHGQAAALAALQILNKHGFFENKLSDFKK